MVLNFVFSYFLMFLINAENALLYPAPFPYWRRFCQGSADEIWCNSGTVIIVLESSYGSFDCLDMGAYLDVDTDTCTLNVTEKVQEMCNGMEICFFNVNDTSFGDSGCNEENLWIKHMCGTPNAETTPVSYNTDMTSEENLVCKCMCETTTNTSNTEQDPETKLTALIDAIKIEKKSTRRYLNSKRSAPDDRVSSKTIGIVGIIVVLCPIIVIIVSDSMNAVKKRNLKKCSSFFLNTNCMK